MELFEKKYLEKKEQDFSKLCWSFISWAAGLMLEGHSSEEVAL
jgi:hypothetical protein